MQEQLVSYAFMHVEQLVSCVVKWKPWYIYMVIITCRLIYLKMTHEDTTISDLVKHFRLKDAWLEKAIDQTDIGKLTDKRDLTSEFSVSKWKKWAKKLGIVLEESDTDDSGVTEQGAKGDIYRCQKILEMWKQKCGSIRPATFKKLAQVFLDGQNTFLAEQVCNYVQGKINSAITLAS